MAIQRIRTLKGNRVLLLICIQIVIIQMGHGIIAPILPLYAQTFDVSVMLIGFLVSVYGLARIITDLPAGRLAERFGRRSMLIFASVITGLSSLGMALSTEFWQLIVFRFLLGVSSAIHVVTAQIALA
ncbi:MAG: MFS transporter, partial [Dehalococcoidia bacterium]|nr:MFS transporter [Dehalococcoidia bacterium]